MYMVCLLVLREFTVVFYQSYFLAKGIKLKKAGADLAEWVLQFFNLCGYIYRLLFGNSDHLQGDVFHTVPGKKRTQKENTKPIQ